MNVYVYIVQRNVNILLYILNLISLDYHFPVCSESALHFVVLFVCVLGHIQSVLLFSQKTTGFGDQYTKNIVFGQYKLTIY